ncbi:MAG: hypothetical protein ACK4S0_11735 [Sediminibacterium sp.]
MKKIFISFLFLLCALYSIGQKKKPDFLTTITNYLSGLEKENRADSTHLFAIALQTEQDESISKTKIFYYKADSIHFLENDRLLSYFNASDLALYMEDGCLPKQQNLQSIIILPFVLKHVKVVLKPKKEPVLIVSDFEKMIHLLRHTQKDSSVLGKPIVVFIEEPYY